MTVLSAVPASPDEQPLPTDRAALTVDTRFVPAGLAHGNAPNVFAEIGSTWRSVMHDPDQAAHLLGKLITHVGPARVAWGTDSLWYGSPATAPTTATLWPWPMVSCTPST